MFQNRLLKAASTVLLAVSIVICSGCAVFSSNSFLRTVETSKSASSTGIPTEEIQMNNECTEFTSGYSYVDFSDMDTELVFAQEQNGSLLGQPGYCYQTLSEEEQALYEEIYKALMTFESACVLRTTDSDQVKKVYNHVVADHPEIFWTEGYTLNTTKRGSTVISLDFSMQQTMSCEQIADWQSVIGAWIQKFSAAAKEAGIYSGSSDYEIIKFTFDYIVRNTEYETDAENNQNICSVFGNGCSVCQGYSVAMQYMLLYQGIQCVTVAGVTRENQTSHAWNLVKADGDWYYLDVTWGDPSFTESSEMLQDVVNYSYFCVTEEEIARTHLVDDRLTLPECTATRDNYFVREGYYFEDWDEEQFQELMAACIAEGKGYISIRMKDAALYEEMRKALIDDQKIFSYIDKGSAQAGVSEVFRLSYFENKNLNIMTFLFGKSE